MRLAQAAVYLGRVERTLGNPAQSLRLAKLTALDTLNSAGGLTAEQLARDEGVSQPTMLVTLEHLAQLGLVARRRSRGRENDRRIRVTAKGRRQLAKEQHRLSQLLEGITRDEQRAIGKALFILERVIDEQLGRQLEQRHRALQALSTGQDGEHGGH